jgi:trehalose utilization protein
MKTLIAAALLLAPAPQDAKLRVLVWDEQQEAQKKAYPNYLGNHLAEELQKEFDVRSVSIKDPDQGLSKDNLEWADVVVWWGHQKHKDVDDHAVAAIVDRLKAGKTGLVALHSAHYSKVFKSAMWERYQLEVLQAEGRVGIVKGPEGKPAILKREQAGPLMLTLAVPACGLGGWRADGLPSHVETKLPAHPIAKGVPEKFDIPQTEMYNEPFAVPEPDAVVFFETWGKGESFRSGCCWDVGQGRVFYFRPGHETYPVFHQAETLTIVRNGVRWAGKRS